MEGWKLVNDNLKEVFFLLKFVEAVLGGIAMGIHIYGFLQFDEPLPHEMFFCGTYMGYTMIAIFAMVVICIGLEVPLAVEAIIAGFGAILFIIGSLLSMYHAERDFHLMYLSDREEAAHTFFAVSKNQSITSMVAGLTYMLHATFTLDALFVNPTQSQLDLLQVSVADKAAAGPIELVLFCKPWCKMLLCCKRSKKSEDSPA